MKRASSKTWQNDPTTGDFSKGFESIFLENWTPILEFLCRMVGDPAEAEDLALETFYRLYQNPPDSWDEFNLGGWLHRVAGNLGLNAIRGWKRREYYELEAGKEVEDPGSPSDPAEILIAKEEHQNIRRILSEMNHRQALLIILRHSGMAYREIATVLGLSTTSIGPLLFRAEKEFERRYRSRTQEEGG